MIHAWTTTSDRRDNWGIVRIANSADSDTRQFINVTRTDRAHEAWSVWTPSWTGQ